MKRKSLMGLVLAVFLLPAFCIQADTFKNKTTGEVFYGFRTQKQTAQKTLVYNDNEKKLVPVVLSEYEVSLDQKGRQNSVILVTVKEPEVMLSEAVSKTVAEAIVRASNTGPRFILLQIDSPGGRGTYMQTICQAITQTSNCPVVAYINGGTYGGAHSAAAVVALACEKIYISPTASISAVSPYVASGRTPQQQSEYLNMYCSDSLASFSAYAGLLAERYNRPSLPAKALLDKRISIVEVMDSDGNKSIIEKGSRLPSQTVIRTITQGLSEPLGTSSSQEQPASAAAGTEAPASVDIYSRVLTLTPTDALAFKLVDRLAGNVSDVLADMKAPDAQLANAPGIDDMIGKFVAGKRNISQALARIEFLEGRTSTLEKQLDEVEKQINTGTVTREVSRSSSHNQRGQVNLPRGYRNDSSDVQGENNQDGSGIAGSRFGTDARNSRRRKDVGQRETVKSTEPSKDVEFVRAELSDVLRNLIAEYRRTIGLANRWVGALPPEITVQTLTKNMESAMALADNIQLRR